MHADAHGKEQFAAKRRSSLSETMNSVSHIDAGGTLRHRCSREDTYNEEYVKRAAARGGGRVRVATAEFWCGPSPCKKRPEKNNEKNLEKKLSRAEEKPSEKHPKKLGKNI